MTVRVLTLAVAGLSLLLLAVPVTAQTAANSIPRYRHHRQKEAGRQHSRRRPDRAGRAFLGQRTGRRWPV